MTGQDFGQTNQPLPTELRLAPMRFSVIRVVVLSLGIFIAAYAASVFFPAGDVDDFEVVYEGDEAKEEKLDVLDAESSEIVNPVAKSQEQTITPKDPTKLSSGNQGLERPASPRALDFKKDIKKVFVNRDIINLRQAADGKVVSQLTRGTELIVLDWKPKAEFLKVTTPDAEKGFASRKVLSDVRPNGSYLMAAVSSRQVADDVRITSVRHQNRVYLDLKLKHFESVLNAVPIKPSFNFQASNLNYLIGRPSQVFWPSNVDRVVGLLKSWSRSPNVSLKRIRSPESEFDDIDLTLSSKILSMRLGVPGSAEEQVIDGVRILQTCPWWRAVLNPPNKKHTDLELILLGAPNGPKASLKLQDVKSKDGAKFGLADIDGDGVQDLAVYFGGTSGGWIYGYLFIAHNVNGFWQLNEVDDQVDRKSQCRGIGHVP